MAVLLDTQPEGQFHYGIHLSHRKSNFPSDFSFAFVFLFVLFYCIIVKLCYFSGCTAPKTYSNGLRFDFALWAVCILCFPGAPRTEICTIKQAPPRAIICNVFSYPIPLREFAWQMAGECPGRSRMITLTY